MARPLATSLAFLVSSLLVAGCATDGGDGGEPSPSSTWAPPADPCPGVGDATTPPAWTRHGGQWGAVAAREGRVDLVCGKATSSLDSLVSDLLGPFTDLELNVTYAMLVGDWGLTTDTLHKADAGAGVVLHYADPGNYTIVRYSPREQGWHLFTMIDGSRQKRDEASVLAPTTNPGYHDWIQLRVRSEGGHVTAFDGVTKVIDYQLPADAPTTGRVGYFLRDAGMVALFDDLTVVPLA